VKAAPMHDIGKITISDKILRKEGKLEDYEFDEMKKHFPALFTSGDRIDIKPYIDNMPLILTAADIAITRSGAITLAELCRSGTPSILIPSPNVSANHQYINASYIQGRGAALLIEEKDLTSEALYKNISSLIASPERMATMARMARATSTKDTEKAIKNVISQIFNQNRSS
jgi:UDP-N-acetylglucosamine--N-acetylmuramyl-(pentapeptide) pyrophosphoryl-undecaprenol N-acetylglucosamine transferase